MQPVGGDRHLAIASYTAYGQLTLDTEQLTQALQCNPQAVMALFTTSLDSSGNLLSNSSQQGLATRLFNTLTNSISQITDKAGTTGPISRQQLHRYGDFQ